MDLKLKSMKNKEIIKEAVKYIKLAEKDTYAIRKAFVDGAKWMDEQKSNNLILGGVVKSLTPEEKEKNATLQMTLEADSGYMGSENHKVSPDQYARIQTILNEIDS